MPIARFWSSRRPHRISHALAVALLGFACCAPAATAGPAERPEENRATASLGLEAALAEAEAHSPAIAALDAAIVAARARAVSAGSWPNPSLVAQSQLSTNAGNNMVTVGFRQPLDFRGLTAQRRAHAEEEVEYLQHARAVASLRERSAVREAYWRMALALEAVQARDSEVAAVQREHTRAQRRVAAGALAVHELVHTEHELAHSRLDAQAARHELARAQLRFNLLLGRPGETPVRLAPRALETFAALGALDEYQRTAFANRPEWSQAGVALRRENRAVRLAEALRFGEGEIDLEGGTTSNTDPTLYAAFALPVPLWNDQRAEVTAAQAQSARVAAEQAGVRRDLQLEVAQAYLDAQQARDRLREVTESLLKLAEHGLEKAEARVKVGAASPEEILVARKDLLAAQLARLERLLELHLADARLQSAIGR